MRATARETFTCYHNYELHNIKAGDVLEGDLAAYALATLCPVDHLDAPQAPVDEGELVITDTTAAVLAWVGDNPDRAAEALAAEQATDKPRTGLITALGRLAPQGGESADGAAPPAGNGG